VALSERQQTILGHIVELHVATAEPVGSRQLVKHTNIGVSPATIRNEMADLEELGYLEQPHTSSGRVPTDLGYRYYVDQLRASSVGPQDERVLVELEHAYLERCSEVRSLLESAVRILSQVSQLTSVAVSPSHSEKSIRKVQLVGIDGNRILMVVIGSSGLVTNHTLEAEASVPQAVLNRLSEIINENFSRDSVKRLLADEIVMLREIESQYRSTVHLLLKPLQESLCKVAVEDKLYLEGLTLILDQPEFRNFEKARHIVERFLDKSELSGFLREDAQTAVHATIGAETKVPGLEDFALITSPYAGANGRGTIGVLGPRRMQYARVMALVKWMSHRLSEILKG